MDALKEIIPLVLTASLAGLVLAVGLDSEPGDLRYMFNNPMRLARAVLVISVLVPALAILLVKVLPMRAVTSAGVILLAISPVPPFVPGRNRSVGGSRQYAYGLFAAFALLAIVIVPVSVMVMNLVFGTQAPVGPWPIAELVVTSVVIPLGFGIAGRMLWPGLARKAAGIISKGALGLLVLVLIPLLFKLFPIFGDLIGDGTLLCSVLLALGALAFGHLLGDGEPGDRASLAIAAGTRHPGIAGVIAGAATTDKHVMAAAVLCFLTCFVVTATYQVAMKRRIAHAPAVVGSR